MTLIKGFKDLRALSQNTTKESSGHLYAKIFKCNFQIGNKYDKMQDGHLEMLKWQYAEQVKVNF